MKAETIARAVAAGKTVIYTVRRLRGYLHGDASLVFQPGDGQAAAPNNVKHRLECFRRDERPYDSPRWEQR